MAREAPARLKALLARLTLAPLVALGLGLAVVPFLGPSRRAKVLAGAVGLALATAWFVARRAQLLWEASTEALDEGLRALSQGRFGEVGGREGGLLDGSVRLLAASVAAVESREAAARSFGAEADPAQAGERLALLQAPAREAVVGVLAVRWRGLDEAMASLDPAARLAALGRYYESVLEAVTVEGASVLELGGGTVVAVWGAPAAVEGGLEPDPQAVLRAGWSVRLRLDVMASQLRLRRGVRLEWGCGAAWGPAATGAWGPAARRRWALVGVPLGRARDLAGRVGGPWLDPELVPAAVLPYAAVPKDGSALLAGPENY